MFSVERLSPLSSLLNTLFPDVSVLFNVKLQEYIHIMSIL